MAFLAALRTDMECSNRVHDARRQARRDFVERDQPAIEWLAPFEIRLGSRSLVAHAGLGCVELNADRPTEAGTRLHALMNRALVAVADRRATGRC